jgi:hypothetical protein
MRKIFVIIIIGIVLTFTICNLTISSNSFMFNIIKNTIHVPLFMIITGGLIYVIGSTGKRLCYAVMIAFFLAGFTEFLQLFNQRTADWYDVMRNLVGITCVVFWVTHHTYQKNFSDYQRRLLSIAILFIVLAVLSPLLYQAYAHVDANQNFPAIENFESNIGMYRFTANQNTSIQRVARYASSGNYSLAVTMQPGPYPGVHVQYFPGDWRAEKIFAINIYNPENDTLKLHFRFDDTDADNCRDWGYVERTIVPEFNKIEIPLHQIYISPPSDSLNSQAIQKFIIFTVQPTHKRTLYIDDIQLK